ncbi:hypothetical protein ACFL35_15975, partial [Candidatus Riflebacteria bacterium]
MNKKAWLKIIFTIPIPLAFFLTNFFVDPSCLYFNRAVTRKIVVGMQKGLKIENISNLDERFLQKEIINNLSKAPETILIGSSRSMEIDSENVKSNNFFNNSLSGLVLEDLLAIIGIYFEKDLVPKNILIEVPPWFFNEFNDQIRWAANFNYFHKMTHRLNVGIKMTERFNYLKKLNFKNNLVEIFNPGYFQSSLGLIVNSIINKKNFYRNRLTSAPSKEFTILYPDGHRFFPEVIDSNAEIKRKALHYALGNPHYEMKKFTKIDQQYMIIFNLLCIFLNRDRKINLTLFLPPYHPVAYKKMMDSQILRIIGQVEYIIKIIASKLRLKVIGSYNPSAIPSLLEDDFRDPSHLKKSGINKLFKDGSGPRSQDSFSSDLRCDA